MAFKKRTKGVFRLFQPTGDVRTINSVSVTVLEVNAADKITRAETLTASIASLDSQSDFAKGALVTVTDASNGNKCVYENVGTAASSTFNLMGEVAVGDIPDATLTYAKMATDDAITKRVTAETWTVTDADDAATGNPQMYLRLDKSDLSKGTLVADVAALELWDGGSGTTLPIMTDIRTYQGTLTLTDDDSAATTGTALYAHYLYGNKALLKSVTANNANSTFEDDSDESYVVIDDDAAAQGGIIVYFDEDAVNADDRFLIVSPVGEDLYVESFVGGFIRLKHDASAASNGVQVYFDDDAADAAASLVFVSPTNASGSMTTMDPADIGDPGTFPDYPYMYTPVYFDEDGASNVRLLHASTFVPHDVLVATMEGTNKFIKVNYDASASSNGVAVYVSEASADAAKTEFVSPTNANGTLTSEATVRPYEVTVSA